MLPVPGVVVTDLPGVRAAHGIELLALDRLDEHFAKVQETGHGFSAIRMRNGGLGPGGFAS